MSEDLPSGSIITFYSFKGGTGRSMAVANVACVLVEQARRVGRRILVVDWDLEAPGLNLYFEDQIDRLAGKETPGILDYFCSLRDILDQDSSLLDSIGQDGGWKLLDAKLPLDSFVIEDVIESIDLIKAGKVDLDYAEKVASFKWIEFYEKYGAVFRAFCDLLDAKYMYSLVDSRTGLSDTSGICTTLLPEKLVAVFSPNLQSLEGLSELVTQAAAYRRTSGDLRPLEVFPLPGRIDLAEQDLKNEWRVVYQKIFESTLSDVYGVPCSLEEYFDEVLIPHVPHYSYGEKIAVLEQRDEAFSLARAYRIFCQRLVAAEEGVLGIPDAGESPWTHEVEIDAPALLAAYLERLIQQASSLSLSGIDPAATGIGRGAQLNLGAVYTALLVLPSAKGESWRKGRQGRSPEETGDFHRVPVLAQLNEHKRLVLLGDPGSGKSTFVNFVALCLAGECLGRVDFNLKLLTTPLPQEADPSLMYREPEEEPQPQIWSHGALLPVRVVLRDLAARGLPEPGEQATAHHLWKFIERDLSGAELGDFAPLLKKDLLERGGLVLLDGLDEVPEAERRREQIRQIVEDFVRAFSKCRVLLTSRTYAYQNQEWRLPQFAEAVLAPFRKGQIALFVDRWYAHVASLGRFDQEGASGRAELLKRAIFGSERIRELAERPLLLTLMASLHAWRGGTLPEKREQLYADAVDLLLNLWSRQSVVLDAKGNPLLVQPSLAEWLKVDQQKVREVLENLAYRGHLSQQALAGTADIAEGDLIAALIQVSRNPEVHHTQLVEYLCHRAGLLVSRGVGVYTFPHRTFQEYLAACHLTDEHYPDRIAELARRDPNRWREVALLAGAKAARGTASSIWSLAEALCWREPGEAAGGTEEMEDLWGAHLAGQAVAESANLERVSGANQEKLERLQRWHVRLIGGSSHPATERALAGKALERLGDPRFDPELWHLLKEPLLGFVEIPAGPFLMGSDKQRDLHTVKEEEPQHQVTLPAFYMSRYPVTVAQFRAFVTASGYSSAVWESLEGPANYPVVNVTRHDAIAYCRWLSERLREVALLRLREGIRGDRTFWEALAQGRVTASLPSEAEWEKAARGPDGPVYPWGDEPDPNRANYYETGLGEPSAVGCFPGGSSPFGCEEMSGNVWEWTRSLWVKAYPYPDEGEERRKREDFAAPGLRVWRGGSCFNISSYARCACRTGGSAVQHASVGFRVALSPSF